MDFLWTRQVCHSFPALEGDKRTDVLVIGGGMAGVLCALKLQKAGVDYILVEGKMWAAELQKAPPQYLRPSMIRCIRILSRNRQGKGSALPSCKSSCRGTVRKLCERIPCDFEEERPSVMYSLDDKPLMSGRRQQSGLLDSTWISLRQLPCRFQ